MRKSPIVRAVALTGAISLGLTACSGTPGESPTDTPSASETGGGQATDTTFGTAELTDGTTTFVVVDNPGDGPTLSYAKDSGFTVLEEKDGDVTYAFKDMNGNGTLDTWEDWRVEAADRAADLAPKLSIEQAAGLMLFSSHERAPGDGLTDAQKTYLSDSKLRNVLHAGPSDIEASVSWANELQAFVETLSTEETPYVPVSINSDPRSDAKDSYAGAAGGVSQWPSSLGMAATFDPARELEFAQVASAEYRALGLSNALSPQIDMGTEPRWLRNNGTFGEDPAMASEFAAAYVEGFQNTYDENGDALGWGQGSVATMIKHFAGDGRGEGGRESHTTAGQFAVATSGDLESHLMPFKAGLEAAGLMTAYSILTDAEGKPAYGDELVGTAYNTATMKVLREDMGYDGVVVTDWGVLRGGPTDPDAAFGMAWGVQDLTVPERIFKTLQTGHDALGGFNDVVPVMEAHALWQAAFEAGELDVDADTRFAQSAERSLRNIFLAGMYENPYQDLEHSLEFIGNAEFVEAGWQAQLDSVVITKNAAGTLTCEVKPDYKSMKVYIPSTNNTGFDGAFGPAEYWQGTSINEEAAGEYFGSIVTDTVELDADGKVVSYTAPDLSDVDLVIVGMESPDNGSNFSNAGLVDSTVAPEAQEFYPLSLQYRPYTADGPNVRKESIAGLTLADGSKQNRSYFGKTSKIANEADLDAFERADAAITASGKDIPLIVSLYAKNPTIPAEFEAKADAIVVGFGVSDAAALEVITGGHQAAGRLPMTFPKDMDTVEANAEDKPFDLAPYVDAAGNSWEFGFGLTCDGSPLAQP
ncbi:MAG TPA: glycoside hydrolase family 3 N-terminal domain-containing protein [Arachnia sp.]|nr:glycoside hydrolase family 3 N-terminal domain-containing protein [Arachnia sp.]HMT86150.1 glycoside hydrolase family 3 N-terminal domain-containing protein [Arachnia sp.]